MFVIPAVFYKEILFLIRAIVCPFLPKVDLTVKIPSKLLKDFGNLRKVILEELIRKDFTTTESMRVVRLAKIFADRGEAEPIVIKNRFGQRVRILLKEINGGVE